MNLRETFEKAKAQFSPSIWTRSKLINLLCVFIELYGILLLEKSLVRCVQLSSVKIFLKGVSINYVYQIPISSIRNKNTEKDHISNQMKAPRWWIMVNKKLVWILVDAGVQCNNNKPTRTEYYCIAAQWRHAEMSPIGIVTWFRSR